MPGLWHQQDVHLYTQMDLGLLPRSLRLGTWRNKNLTQCGSIPNLISNFGKFVFRPSFQIAKLAQADREFGRAIDSVISTVIKIPAVLPLATLLDSNRGGNYLSPHNDPAMESVSLLKKRRKKRKPLTL